MSTLRPIRTMLRSVLLLVLVFAPNSAQAVSKIESQTAITDLQGIIPQFIGPRGVLILWLPAIATIYTAIAGYRYIVSQGNPELQEKAKKSLTYAVYGMVLSYAAVAIIAFVAQALNFRI